MFSQTPVKPLKGGVNLRRVDKAKEQLIMGLIKLRQEKNNLQTTLNRLTYGFFSFDNEWRFVYLNYEAEMMLGKQKEELIGKCVWDSFPELTDSEVYLKYQEAMKKQISIDFEVEGIYSGRWFEVRAYPSKYGLSVFLNDITYRKHHEEALNKMLGNIYF